MTERQADTRPCERLAGSLARSSDHSLLRRCGDGSEEAATQIYLRTASLGVYEVPDGKDLWRLLLTLALNKVRASATFHQAAKRDVRMTTALPAREESETQRGAKGEAPDVFLRLALEDALSALPQ